MRNLSEIQGKFLELQSDIRDLVKNEIKNSSDYEFYWKIVENSL